MTYGRMNIVLLGLGPMSLYDGENDLNVFKYFEASY